MAEPNQESPININRVNFTVQNLQDLIGKDQVARLASVLEEQLSKSASQLNLTARIDRIFDHMYNADMQRKLKDPVEKALRNVLSKIQNIDIDTSRKLSLERLDITKLIDTKKLTRSVSDDLRNNYKTIVDKVFNAIDINSATIKPVDIGSFFDRAVFEPDDKSISKFNDLRFKIISQIENGMKSTQISIPKEIDLSAIIKGSLAGMDVEYDRSVRNQLNKMRTAVLGKISAYVKNFDNNKDLFSGEIDIHNIMDVIMGSNNPEMGALSSFKFNVMRYNLLSKLGNAVKNANFHFDDIDILKVLGDTPKMGFFDRKRLSKSREKILDKIDKYQLDKNWDFDTKIDVLKILGDRPDMGMFNRIRLGNLRKSILDKIESLVERMTKKDLVTGIDISSISGINRNLANAVPPASSENSSNIFTDENKIVDVRLVDVAWDKLVNWSNNEMQGTSNKGDQSDSNQSTLFDIITSKLSTIVAALVGFTGAWKGIEYVLKKLIGTTDEDFKADIKANAEAIEKLSELKDGIHEKLIKSRPGGDQALKYIEQAKELIKNEATASELGLPANFSGFDPSSIAALIRKNNGSISATDGELRRINSLPPEQKAKEIKILQKDQDEYMNNFLQGKNIYPSNTPTPTNYSPPASNDVKTSMNNTISTGIEDMTNIISSKLDKLNSTLPMFAQQTSREPMPTMQAGNTGQSPVTDFGGSRDPAYEFRINAWTRIRGGGIIS